MKVLCVDDHRLCLASLLRKTRRAAPGAEIHSCRIPEAAIRFANKEGCDVLLTEIDLAGEKNGGIELSKKIKAINPRVNIIFVTVCSESEYASDAFKLRASGYITKPYHSSELAKEFANLRYTVT